VTCDLSGITAGPYFLRIEIGSQVMTEKIMIIDE